MSKLNSAFRLCRHFTTIAHSYPKSLLHDVHLEMGATMGDYFKFRLPSSIGNEGEITSHLHSRTFASVFDLSFYKHLIISCKNEGKFLDSIISNDITCKIPTYLALKPGHSFETFIINDGKIFDLISLYKYEDKILLSTYGNMGDTVNMIKESAKGANAIVEPITASTIYVEGPTATQVLSDTLNIASQLKGLDNNAGIHLELLNNKCYLIKRGLMPNDSYQIITTGGESDIYKQLLTHETLKPAGIKTFLSIALESGAAIPGVDITQDLTPHEATMPHCISKSKSDNFGKGVLRRYLLKLDDGPVPSPNSNIYINENLVGKITSIYFSPIYQSLLASGLIKSSDVDNLDNLTTKSDDGISQIQILNVSKKKRLIYGDNFDKKTTKEPQKKRISTQALVEGLCRAAIRVKFGHLTPEAAKKSLGSHIQGCGAETLVSDTLLKILLFVAKDGYSENLVDFAYQVAKILSNNTLFILWEKLLSSTLIKEKKLRISVCTVIIALIRRACNDQLEIPDSLFSKHALLFRGMILENSPEFKCCALQALENFQDGLLPIYLHCLLDQHHTVRIAAIKYIEIPPPESEDCEKVYIQIVHRALDSNHTVRSQVFTKLQSHEQTLPLDLKIELLRLGGLDKVASVRNAALKMFKKWVQNDLTLFLDKYVDKLYDFSFMEPVLAAYLKTYKIGQFLEHIVTLKPSELFVLQVYLSNHSAREERDSLDLSHLLSYCRELLNLDKEQALAAIAANPEMSPDEFQDAIEDDLSNIYRYNQKEHDDLAAIYYTNNHLKTFALSQLFIIMHHFDMIEIKHAEIVIDTCSMALQSAPHQYSVESCMLNVISTGGGSRPANWLKHGFIYPCVCLLRKAIDRICKSDKVLNPYSEFTKRVLLIISDIKDPFGGVSNDDDNKFNVEDMSTADLTKRSEKLALKVKHKSDQLAELEATKVNAKDQEEALKNEINQALESIRKMSNQLSQLRIELKNRWHRVAGVIDAFLMLSKSSLKVDSSLCDFPSELLLPALEFFATKAPEWPEYDFSDQLCEIIISKSLGNWCLLCGTKDESLRQIKAFTAALDGSLKALWESLVSLSKLHSSVGLKMFQQHKVGYGGISCNGVWVDLDYTFSQIDLKNKLAKMDESFNNNYKTQMKKVDVQTLRCELYLSTLGDLIATSPYIYQTYETQHVLISYIWPIISGKYQTSKRIQSIALKSACKILLTCLTQKLDDEVNPPFDDEILGSIAKNIRCLLEMAFLLPPAPNHIVSDFKIIKTHSVSSISPLDKQYIIKLVSMFVLASTRHKKILHIVIEQILTRTVHGILIRKIPVKGVTKLIAFLTQTCFFKSDPEMVAETFPNYMKWLLLVLIDKAPLLQADRSSFAKFVAEALDAYLNVEVGGRLAWKLGFEKDEDGTIKHLHNFIVLIEYIISDYKVRPFEPILKQLKTILTEKGKKFDDEKANRDIFNRLVQSYDKNLQGKKGSRDLEISLATKESDSETKESERKSSRIKKTTNDKPKVYESDGEEDDDDSLSSDYEEGRKAKRGNAKYLSKRRKT